MKVLKSNYFFLVFILIALTGCAHVKEMSKGVLGISTNEIEKERPRAIKKVFACDYKKAYDNTLVALANMGSYVYAKTNDLVAIYVSEEDTTVVGIFFKAIDASNTKLEVSSPSTYAKEFIADRLFARIELLLTLKEGLKKEEIDKLMTESDKIFNQQDQQPQAAKEEVNPVIKEEIKSGQFNDDPGNIVEQEPKTQDTVITEPTKQ